MNPNATTASSKDSRLAKRLSSTALLAALPPAAPQEADAVAEIKKLGGAVRLDGKSGEVIEIRMSGGSTTDAELEHLKGLTSVRSLNLNRTQITDAGLEHLKALTSLKTLDLGHTQITDAGLIHLKGLTRLTTLTLDSPKITDAGLVHLKDLASLTELKLSSTQVTDGGLEHVKGLTRLTSLCPQSFGSFRFGFGSPLLPSRVDTSLFGGGDACGLAFLLDLLLHCRCTNGLWGQIRRCLGA